MQVNSTITNQIIIIYIILFKGKSDIKKKTVKIIKNPESLNKPKIDE
jgi:hypothetical protein